MRAGKRFKALLFLVILTAGLGVLSGCRQVQVPESTIAFEEPQATETELPANIGEVDEVELAKADSSDVEAEEPDFLSDAEAPEEIYLDLPEDVKEPEAVPTEMDIETTENISDESEDIGTEILENVEEPEALTIVAPEVSSSTEENPDEKSKGYRVRVSDILNIKASPDREEMITGEAYEVDEAGSIKLIYLNDVYVEGLTKIEIQDKLEELYSSYYKNIAISVTVLRFYYISGEVRQPSRYTLVRRTTLTEAVDIAGGFTDFAKKSRITITRMVDGRPEKKRYSYKKIRDGKAEDPELLPDDRIFVRRGGW